MVGINRWGNMLPGNVAWYYQILAYVMQSIPEFLAPVMEPVIGT